MCLIALELIINDHARFICDHIWNTYHLHTSEIIRISDFAPLWLKVTCLQTLFLQ